ncbi:hypothetical protein BDD39_000977 [Saccharococcus thermophilus]|uniref:Uncharacterized protein n=1 Tax=Saccharococcus thermophilus TaxID=29396 RepID=A0A846MDA6_9BACL|nr:hypothetical protein [Saccharococcus thermophilus]
MISGGFCLFGREKILQQLVWHKISRRAGFYKKARQCFLLIPLQLGEKVFHKPIKHFD